MARRLPILRPLKLLEDLIPEGVSYDAGFAGGLPPAPTGPGSPGFEYSGAPGYIPDTGISSSQTPFSTLGAPALPPPGPPQEPESLENRAKRELDLGEMLLGPARGALELARGTTGARLGEALFREPWEASAYSRLAEAGWDLGKATELAKKDAPSLEGGLLSAALSYPGVGAASGALGIAGAGAKPFLSTAGKQLSKLSKGLATGQEGMFAAELGAKAGKKPGTGFAIGETPVVSPKTETRGMAGGEPRGTRSRLAPRFSQARPTAPAETVTPPRAPLWQLPESDVATLQGKGPRAVPADVGPPPVTPPPIRPISVWEATGRPPGGLTGAGVVPPEPGLNPLAQVEEALKPVPKTAWQRLVEAKDAFVRGALDKNAPLMTLEKQTGIPIHQLAQRIPGMKAWGERIIQKEFEPVLAPLGKDITELEKYMVIKRGEDILARNPSAIGPWGATGWGGQIEALNRLKIQMGPERFSAVEEAADKIYGLSRQYIIQPLYRQGILSKEAAEAILTAHPHYIDFHRLDAVISGVAGGTKPVASLSKTGLDRMALEGSAERLDQPLARLLTQVISTQERIARNQTGRALVRGLLKVDPELKLLGEGATTPSGKGLVSYFEGGQKGSLAVDPIWATVAKGLEAESANWLSRAFMAAATPLRTGATTYNPAFVVINPIRDAVSAMFKEGITTVLHPDYVKGWVAALTKNSHFDDAAQAGVFMSGIIDSFRSTRDLTRIASRRVLGIPVDSVGDLAAFIPRLVKEMNTASERATRVAAFMKGQREGKSTLESAIMGRDVTVDFSKSGNVIKLLNQAIPFLNAGIQGAANTLKVMRTQPEQAILRASPLAAASAMFYLNNQRYETSRLIPDYEYANNWIVQFGEGVKDPDPKTGVVERYPVYIKIPKGPTGALLTAPVEMALRLAFAAGDRSLVGDLLESAQTAGEALSPVSLSPGSLVVPLVSTIVETAANKSFFTGRDIVPQKEQGRLPSQQFGSETSKTAVAIGKQFGISPRLIEYGIRDYTAGAGQTSLWAVDTALGALGYNPQAPGAAMAQGKTEAEAAARTPVVSRFLGVRNTEQEARDWDTFNQAVEESKKRFGLSPELSRLGIFPGAMGESFSSGGTTVYFTTPERTEMQKALAGKAAPILKQLVGSTQYQALKTSTQKKEVIERAFEMAREQVRNAMVRKVGSDELRRRATLAVGARP